jgi:hypothetical protein
MILINMQEGRRVPILQWQVERLLPRAVEVVKRRGWTVGRRMGSRAEVIGGGRIEMDVTKRVVIAADGVTETACPPERRMMTKTALSKMKGANLNDDAGGIPPLPRRDQTMNRQSPLMIKNYGSSVNNAGRNYVNVVKSPKEVVTMKKVAIIAMAAIKIRASSPKRNELILNVKRISVREMSLQSGW